MVDEKRETDLCNVQSCRGNGFALLLAKATKINTYTLLQCSIPTLITAYYSGFLTTPISMVMFENNVTSRELLT